MGALRATPRAALVLALLYLLHADHAAPVGGRLLLAEDPAVDPIADLAPRQPLDVFLQRQGASSTGTLAVIAADVATRLTGDRFVPFSREDQWTVIRAMEEVVVPKGPVEIYAIRESQADLAAPEGIREVLQPSVEIWYTVYWAINRTASGELPTNGTFGATGWEMYILKAQLNDRILQLGNWTGRATLKDAFVNLRRAQLTGGYMLRPLVPLVCQLAVALADSAPGGGAQLSAEQASLVGQAVEAAVVGKVGSLVEVVGRGEGSGAGAGDSQPHHFVELEVTMYLCRENASLASPECERRILDHVLRQLAAAPEVQAQWLAAGIKGIQIVSIAPRALPLAPSINATAPVAPQPWVPWHLDRIDQRSLPLDGRYTATATGAGVNVYIISSGVLATHEEFGYLDGSPGSRVKPAWGYQGLKPQEDCEDFYAWFGFGTYVSSLCCGLKLGAAKNATIHSVRYRRLCMEDPTVWDTGALPPALDLVLSAHVKPAVVLIDTWWDNQRTVLSNSDTIYQDLSQRLDRLQAAGLTVIVGAGPERQVAAPCDNIFAAHPGVISVAASDTRDQATAYGPWNSSCISIWAPSGGVGVGLIGADPGGPRSYTRIVDRSFGAAAVVAGVAAQYLERHPGALATEVKAALQAMATPGTVLSAGPASLNALLFSDIAKAPAKGAGPAAGDGSSSNGSSGAALVGPPPLASSPQPAAPASSGSSGSGGLSSGAIAAIAVVAALVVATALAGFLFMARRRRQLAAHHPSKIAAAAGWEVAFDDIEICRRPDGSEWLLGEGRYGKVYKAMKGGVQVVAVKRLHHVNESLRTLFVKEVSMMKFVSRDANVTQFYGACVRGDDMMLVAEYMEGGDLRSAISRDAAGELQWYRRGAELMLDVVRGAHFLHANSIVHRDIKSANILLARDGRAKLADVGLATLLGPPQGAKSASGADSSGKARGSAEPKFAGTLAWAAPELLLGEPVTEKADIYSLGIVLWELVTRERPQRGCLRDPEVPRECPQAVAAAISACMQRDPAMRPTARELHALLVACAPGTAAGHVAALAPSSREASLPEGISEVEGGASGSSSTGGAQGSGAASAANPSRQISTASLATADKPSSAGPALSARLSSHQLSSSSDLSLATIDFAKVEFCKDASGAPEKLGAGSFGAVYKAALDGVQPLAAKSIVLGDSPEVQDAFLREAGLLWKLRHRNIVGLTGVSISEGRGYLLMELMEGGSLHRSLNLAFRSSGQRVFGWYSRGRQVALDVARGLHYLHSMRIVHFDLKSGNILLTKELTAKVADVGLSRVLSCTHHSLSGETSGPPGTLAYMAPELMLGTKCTQAVDIYSYGVLLKEICTGTHPIRGRCVDLRVPEDCPQAVADLYLRCVASDPADRPTARELVELLVPLASEGGSPHAPEASDQPTARQGSPPGARAPAGHAGHDTSAPPTSSAAAQGGHQGVEEGGGGGLGAPPRPEGGGLPQAQASVARVSWEIGLPGDPRLVMPSPFEALRHKPFPGKQQPQQQQQKQRGQHKE